MAADFSPSGPAAAAADPPPSAAGALNGRGSGSNAFQASQSEWDADALAGLYKVWLCGCKCLCVRARMFLGFLWRDEDLVLWGCGTDVQQ